MGLKTSVRYMQNAKHVEVKELNFLEVLLGITSKNPHDYAQNQVGHKKTKPGQSLLEDIQCLVAMWSSQFDDV